MSDDTFDTMAASIMDEVPKKEFAYGDVIPQDDAYYASTIKADLWYPRSDGRKDKIRVGLYDVRASNDITLLFDFGRSGWVVLSDLYDPEEDDDLKKDFPDDFPLHEVAFIPAWPLADSSAEGRSELQNKDAFAVIAELYSRTSDVLGNLQLGDAHIQEVEGALRGDIRQSKIILFEIMHRLQDCEKLIDEKTAKKEE